MRTISYLVTRDRRFFSAVGPDREKIIEEELLDGGRVILTVDEKVDTTENESACYAKGVFDGYEAAFKHVERFVRGDDQ